MFYSIIRVIVRTLIYLINGKPKYLNRENLPTGNYILVGPHRTWFDPVYYALAASPKKNLVLWLKRNYSKIRLSATF